MLDTPLPHHTDARDTYLQCLSLLTPLWSGRPDTPRWIFRRVALRLLEVARDHGDVLLGVALLRRHHNDIAEHSLKVAVVLALLAQHLELPSRVSLRAVSAGLLHRLGHETQGALARSTGHLAQRSLVTLLLDPDPDTSAYQQTLAAFQHRLGLDGRGQPLLEFPTRPHPLALLLGLCNAFVEQLCGSPSSPAPIPPTLSDVLSALRAATTTHDPTLVKLLIQAIGPAPVGALLALPDGRQALSLRCVTSQESWRGVARVLSDQPNAPLIPLGSHLPDGGFSTLLDSRPLFAAM